MFHEMRQTTRQQADQEIRMALPGEEGQPSKAEGTNVFVRILVLLFVVACFGVGKGVLLGLIHALTR